MRKSRGELIEELEVRYLDDNVIRLHEHPLGAAMKQRREWEEFKRAEATKTSIKRGRHPVGKKNIPDSEDSEAEILIFPKTYKEAR